MEVSEQAPKRRRLRGKQTPRLEYGSQEARKRDAEDSGGAPPAKVVRKRDPPAGLGRATRIDGRDCVQADQSGGTGKAEGSDWTAARHCTEEVVGTGQAERTTSNAYDGLGGTGKAEGSSPGTKDKYDVGTGREGIGGSLACTRTDSTAVGAGVKRKKEQDLGAAQHRSPTYDAPDDVWSFQRRKVFRVDGSNDHSSRGRD